MKRHTLAIALTAGLLGSGGLVAQTATDANVAPPSQDQMQAAMTTPAGASERGLFQPADDPVLPAGAGAVAVPGRDRLPFATETLPTLQGHLEEVKPLAETDI
jgi:hypothetical protein